MKYIKALLAGCLIFFLGTIQPANSQDKNRHQESVDHILMKMQQANSLVKYQGIMTTIVINTPISEVYRYKIENYGSLFRKEEVLTDGPDKEIDYDDGKNLWRFFPNKNFLIKETTKLNSKFKTKPDVILNLVKKNYEIKIAGEYKSNQRTGYKVIFKPKNQDRPRQIFWIDSETGIPFKVEKYGSDNDLISVSSFSDIDFQMAANKENLDLLVPPQTEINEISEKFNLTMAEAKTRIGEGISYPGYIPQGFDIKNIILRSFGSEKTLHFFYTDGLSAISIFQKPLAPHNNTINAPTGKIMVNEKTAVITSSGTMNIINIHTNQMDTTIMGEIFKETVIKIAESLNQSQYEREPPAPLRSVNSAPAK